MNELLRLTEHQKQVYDVLCSMPLANAGDPTFHSLIRALLDRKYWDYRNSEEAKAAQQKVLTVNQSRRDREADKAAKRELWAKPNLRSGMIIRVDGTRDGHGLRLVDHLENYQIVCIQLNRAPKVDSAQFLINVGPNRVLPLSKSSQMTTHLWNKVKEYAVMDEHGRFDMVKVPV